MNSILDSLNEYKTGLETLKGKVKDLALKNKDLKSNLTSTKQENLDLKDKLKELKESLKETNQKSNLIITQNVTIKKLEKRLRDSELEKTRMSAEFGRVNKELQNKLSLIREENSTQSNNIKRKSKDIFSRPASVMLED